MANLYGTGPNQVPLNSMLGNLAFQDKAYVSVDKVGIGTTFVDSGTSGQILQVYGGGAYVSGSVGIGTTNPTSALTVVGDAYVTGIVTASSYRGDGSLLTGISAGALSISTNTTNQAQYIPYVTSFGSTTGLGATTLLVYNPSTGNLGIGTTNPTSKLYVVGDTYITGVVTASSFSGTATSTTNIPNLTGAITSVNTTTSLGSFTSLQLATALGVDKTGTGLNVFATSPTLVTPVLGSATATSIVVGSGVTLNASGVNVTGIVTALQFSTGASGTGVNITTNTISGPAELIIDPAAVNDNTGAVRIKGDLFVDGTQTFINSTTIELADFNVGIASTVGTNSLLDGAGIGIGSTGIRKTLTWSNSSTALKSSEDFDLESGKSYKINGTSVLSSTTLGSGVLNSSLTSVGTLGQLQVTGISTLGVTSTTNLTTQQLNVTGLSTFAGITTHTASVFGTQASFTGIVTATSFSGNATSATYATTAGIATYATTAGISTNLKGGTGGSIPYQNNVDLTVFLAPGTSGYVLQSNGVSNAPTWVSAAPAGAITGLTIRDEGTIVGTANSVSALNFVGAIVSAASTSGIATITFLDYVSNSGIATYATTAGVSISVIGGIGSITQLQVTGISTLGVTSTTNLTTQQLTVSGVSTFSSNVLIPSSDIGIGTTSIKPGYKLDVRGNTYITGDIFLNSTTGQLSLTGRPNYSIGGGYSIVDISHPAGGSLYGLYGWQDTGNDRIFQQLSDYTDFFTALGNDSEFIIGATGGVLDGSAYSFKVGIGSETSLYFNHSKKLSTTTQGILVSGLTSTTSLNVGTGGTIITTTSSGLVGIGTTNPTSTLSVVGTGNFTGIVTASSYRGDGSLLTGISAGALSISTNTTNQAQYIPYVTSFGSTTGLGATTLLVYNPSTGNLGIGTTNPTSALYVVGDTYITGISTFQSSNLKIRNPSNTFEYSIVGSAIVANRNLTLPLLTSNGTIAVLSENQTFTASINFSDTLQATSGSQVLLKGSSVLSHEFGTNQTSATLTFGGTAGTGSMILGLSTVSQQTDIQAGVNTSGTQKTVNIATGGASGSRTLLTLGSATAGAISTVTIPSPTNLLIGSATTTGTASQPLQVTGGAAFYGTGSNVGIGTTNPTSKLYVVGGTLITGIASIRDVTIDKNTTSPNATVPIAVIGVTTTGISTETNIDVALIAKGTGATLAQVPDGTPVGGNKRGTNATDWQKSRTINTHVASGNFSVIAGGQNNTASTSHSFVGGGQNNIAQTGTHTTVCGGSTNSAYGLLSFVGGGESNTAFSGWNVISGGYSNFTNADYATVCGGGNNQATGNYSTVAGGRYGTTRGISGMLVMPACVTPITSNLGVTQSALLLLARQTTDATVTVLTSNSIAAGTTNQVVLPNNSAYFFKGSCIAGVTGAGDTKSWEFKGAIKRGATAGSTSIVGSVIKDVIASDSGASAWDISITADITNGGISVTVTGQTSTTIRWVCKIETTEMTY